MKEASAREADAYLPPTLCPGAVQQRLDALETKLDDELLKAASTRETDVSDLKELINSELSSEKAVREAHQSSAQVGHAALEQRLNVVARALHDSVDKHSSALAASHASLEDLHLPVLETLLRGRSQVRLLSGGPIPKIESELSVGKSF